MKKANSLQTLTSTPIKTRAEMEDVVAAIVHLQVHEAKVNAQMLGAIEDIRSNYGETLEAMKEDEARLLALAQAWAEANPHEFAGASRSIQMSHAKVGFRKGPPKLQLLSRKWNWENVLAQLKVLRLARFIRQAPEVNKEAILAERDRLGNAGLKELGLKVEQMDRFYVASEIGTEAVELKEAA